MAKAFFNGGKLEVVGNDPSADASGLLFSTVVMVSIAGISLWSFLLLMQAYMVVPGSFGGESSGAHHTTKLRSSDMGGALYGKYMRISILVSLTVSQIGFVCGKLAITTLCYIS